LLDYLDDESAQDFEVLKSILDEAGIAYTINPRLVRGLDYYCKTVFEWVTDQLGAQGTVCAGGRYDGLVAQLGGRETPAIGFALGIERLLALQEQSTEQVATDEIDIYLLLQGEGSELKGLILAEELRDALPWLRLLTHCGGGSFKSQMKKADKSGAALALILGEAEISAGKIAVKFLRTTADQQLVAHSDLIEFIQTHI
jgi:histidyl-tRNA synthetase